MNISYKWLKELLDFNLSVNNVSDLLTDIGLEVEKVNDYEYNLNNSIIIEKICEYEEKNVFDKSKSYWVRYFIDNYPQIFLNNIDTIRNYKYKKDFTEKKNLCYTLNNEYYDLFKVLIIHSDKFDDFYELLDYYKKTKKIKKDILKFYENEYIPNDLAINYKNLKINDLSNKLIHTYKNYEKMRNDN